MFDMIKELCIAWYQRSGGGYAHAIRLQRKGQKRVQEKNSSKTFWFHRIKDLCVVLHHGSGGFMHMLLVFEGLHRSETTGRRLSFERQFNVDIGVEV